MKIQEWDEIPAGCRPGIRYWLPAAAVNEKDLRQEIRSLSERGIGKIEVSCRTINPYILKSEEGWGKEHWNRVVDIIADETHKRGMTFDLTDGPGWPVSMPTVTSPDDEGAAFELTWGAAEYMPGERIPERRTVHQEGTPRLLAVMAYREIKKHVLELSSYTDLFPELKKTEDGIFLPDDIDKTEGRWLVFAFWEQPTAQKGNAGQNYVIDHIGKGGTRACEKYWDKLAGKLKNYDSMESFFCDSMEYHVSMDWTKGFAEEFEKRKGYSILPYLPFIGLAATNPPSDVPGYQTDDPEIGGMLHHDYVEVLTDCYCEYHLDGLEQMAEKYGKTLRYQVAYNKPLQAERAALHCAVPENEALGMATIDWQKTMAAAVHLGRKERYSFECAAEYANAYGQSFEDLFWWVKRSLMAGMNAQVLHGASYSGAYNGPLSDHGNVPMAAWPGFEAFRKCVSNYWNRTLSESDMRGCMDTIARMNSVFRKTAKVDLAVYTDTYYTPGGQKDHWIYDDGGELLAEGYSYEFVCDALLQLPVCRVKNGVLDPEGPAYHCLVIPEIQRASGELLKTVKSFLQEGFPVIWIGKRPDKSSSYAQWKNETGRREWETDLEELFRLDGRSSFRHVLSVRDVPAALKELGVQPRVALLGGRDVMTAVRWDEKAERTWYMLYTYNRTEAIPGKPNPESFGVTALYRSGTAQPFYRRPGECSKAEVRFSLPGRENVKVLHLCSPWSGNAGYAISADENGMFSIPMEEDELVMLAAEDEENGEACREYPAACREQIPVHFDTLTLREFAPDAEGEKSFLRSSLSAEKKVIPIQGECRPWKDLSLEMEEFAGEGCYHGIISLERLDRDADYILRAQEVCDTFHVQVNGVFAPFPDQVKKEADLTGLLKEGDNEITVTVTSNLYNRVIGPVRDQPDLVFRRPMPYRAKSYGIIGGVFLEVRKLIQ